jgi:beta-1,4-mannosyltransferase
LIDLRVHGYFTDDEFYDYVREIDVSALPYRFGTHSGWLEACRDVGTAVVAPSNGCYASQGQIFPFDPDLPGDERWDSFFDAILTAAAARRRGDIEPVGRLRRLRERREISMRHRELYESVIARSRRSAALR